jgi:hypothetical protein
MSKYIDLSREIAILKLCNKNKKHAYTLKQFRKEQGLISRRNAK